MEILSNLNKDNIGTLLIGIGIIAASYILSPLFSYAIIKIFNIKKNGKEIRNNAFYSPLKTIFRIVGIYGTIMHFKDILHFDDATIEVMYKIFKIVLILAFSNGIANSITEKSTLVQKYKQKSDRDIDSTTVIFGVRIVKIVIYIVAIVIIAKDLGYDLNGVITGLGIGSVVITLAAQDTIKNLFGGLVIFLDKPFKVGDYIKFKDYEGTVEYITFRSTKLRTLDNSIAQIPNAEISSTTVENISQIKTRRYTLDLGLVLSTDLEKMMNLEKQILDFLNNDEMVVKDTAHVAFREVRSSDYNVFIYCYIKVTQYADFLREKGRINYIIMDILRKNNIEMAYNTQTIEIKH